MSGKNHFESMIEQCNKDIREQRWHSLRSNSIQLCTVFPDHPHGFAWQSVAEFHLGNRGESNRIANDAVELFPNIPWVWENRARLAALRKDWDLSSKLWVECTELFPESIGAYIGGARALICADSLVKAQYLIDIASEKSSGNWHVMVAQAEVFSAQLDWKGAVDQWAKIRKEFPDNVAAYRRGGDALHKLGNHQGAVSVLIEWILRGENVLRKDYSIAAESLIRRFFDLDIESEQTTRFFRVLINQPDEPGEASAILRQLMLLFDSNLQKFRKISAYFQTQFRKEWSQKNSRERSFALAIGLSSLELDDDELANLISDTTLDEFCRSFSNYAVHEKNVRVLKAFIAKHDEQYLINALSKQGLRNLHIFGAAEGNADQPLYQEIARRINIPYNRKRDLIPLASRSRLRIAVCLSGQLRGYKSAFLTWERLGLKNHDAHYFVHGWHNIGQKYPAPANLARLFSGQFLSAFKEAIGTFGFRHIEAQFPTLFSSYRTSGIANEDEIKNFYGAEKIALEDDESGIFASYTNPMKMFYKIQKSWELAKNSALDFDLVIRIRPDKKLNPGKSVDWYNVYKACSENSIIYTDVSFRLNPDINLFVGDQFAVSTPDLMAEYSQIYAKTLDENGNIRDREEYRRVHRKLAFTLYDAGITALKMPDINLGPPLDPEKLDTFAILALVQKDARFREKTSLDGLFLSALEADLEAIKSSK